MATPLKYVYNPAYFESLLPILREAIPGFDCRQFIFRIFNNSWPDLGFSQRVRHISLVLRHFLSKDYSVAAEQIEAISRSLQSHQEPAHNFASICLADYISVCGLGHSDEPFAVTGGEVAN